MWTQWKGHVLDLGRGLDEAAGTAPVETSGADALASGAEAGVPAGSGEVEMPGAPGVPPPSTGETAVPELGVSPGPGGVAVEQPIYVDPNTQVHQVLDASNQLAMRIGYCTNALVSVGHDLSVSTDSFTTGQVSLRTALEEISTSLQAQAAAVTTLGAGLTFETTEITRLLKAFDHFAATFKWTMSGSNSMEKNLQSIQHAIEDQTGNVVAAVQTGFEGVEKQLRAVAAVLERIAQNTASQGVPPPPTFPPFPPPGGLTAPASVGVPSTAGVEVATPGGTTPLTPGLPGHAARRVGPVPGSAATESPSAAGHMGPPPAPKASGVGCGVPTPRPLAPTLSIPADMTSLFLCYCPEQEGGPRPHGPSEGETPCQRQGLVTRDARSGEIRVLSPTPYRSNEAGQITSLWAPRGLGMLRDNQQQPRRIY